MQKGTLTGGAIVFLTFAVMILLVPANKLIIRELPLPPEWIAFVSKSITMFALGMLLLLLWALRREFLSGLFAPIPANRRVEVAVVAGFKLLQPFAFFGAMALWFWFAEGPVSVENRMLAWRDPDGEGRAFAAAGIAGFLLAVIAAPFIEEVMFRGLLYPAWKERWGWIVSMLLTSAVFAFYHQALANAFVSSMIYVCLFRRTGTLWAPIFVHAAFNASNWHPFLGQFHFPSQALGDLSSWWFHLACLSILAVAVPVYLVMAHREYSESAHHARPVPG